MSNAWTIALTCSRQLGLHTSCLPRSTSASHAAVRALSSLSARVQNAPADTRQSHIPSVLHPKRAFSLSRCLRVKPPKGKTSSSKRASLESAPPRAASPKPTPPSLKLRPQPQAQPQAQPEAHPPETLPRLPNGDLSRSEIEAIFGKGVPPSIGNTFLRMLQQRRLTGSLVCDGVHFENKPPGINDQNLAAALEYLRSNYPMDEQASAAAWMKVEIQRLEQEQIARGQDLGFYKRVLGENYTPRTNEDIYGYSHLEALRRKNEAAWEEKQKMEAEKEAAEAAEAAKTGKAGGLAITNSTGLSNTGGLSPIKSWAELKANRKKSEWHKYHEEQAKRAMLKEIPDLSYTQRLLPSFLVLLATLGLLYIYTQSYTPAPRSARLFPDTPPAMVTVYSIIALNLGMFFLWKYPPAWKFLNKYFLQTTGYPTAFSLLGSIFSHQIFYTHLVPNMLLLWAVGPYVHDQLGRADFLALYIGSAAIGSFASLAWFARTAFGLTTTNCGASGAIYALVTANLVLRDHDDLALPFLQDLKLPYVNWGILGLWVSVTLWSMRGRSQSNGAAHLAGMVAGAAYASWLKRQRRVEEKKMTAQTVWGT